MTLTNIHTHTLTSADTLRHTHTHTSADKLTHTHAHKHAHTTVDPLPHTHAHNRLSFASFIVRYSDSDYLNIAGTLNGGV